jgi:hypothetical protein
MSPSRCPSELELGKHVAGELGLLAVQRLRAHAAACPRCRAELEMIPEERAAFAADPRRRRDLAHLASMAARMREAGPRGGRLRWSLAGLAAGGAVLAAVLSLRPPGPGPRRATDGGLAWTTKGGDLLAVHVETAGGAVPLGATCAAGDRLMASYATGRAYLLLLERDGKGRIQVLLPPGGTTSARLPAPRGTTAESFVLDEAPGPECFAAFFSDAPIEAAQAGAALAAASGSPELPGAVVKMLCCDKEGAR